MDPPPTDTALSTATNIRVRPFRSALLGWPRVGTAECRPAPAYATGPRRDRFARTVRTARDNVTLYMYIGKRHSPCGITANQEFDSGAILYGRVVLL